MSKSDCTPARSEVNTNAPTVYFSQLPNWIVRDPSIPSTMKTMALVLAGYAFGERPSCWPSTKTLAEAVGIDRGHARRVLRAMIARGLIARAPLILKGEKLKRQFILMWKAGADACLKRALEADQKRAPAPGELEESQKIEKPASGGSAVKPPPPPNETPRPSARPSADQARAQARPRPPREATPARSLADILSDLRPTDPFARMARRIMQTE